MQNLLEISGEDIALLSDANLRELIGLLCEADCKKEGVSPSGVTWGGHQDAKDGGLDVVVEIQAELKSKYIPSKSAGFQVKKPKMTESEILNEMKPNGILRSSILAILQKKGSYIIVSSKATCSDTALAKRRQAMQKAVGGLISIKDFHVDFYDQRRIASWISTHPALILWVRNKIGRGLKAWQGYENWSRPGKTLQEYILDNEARVTDAMGAGKGTELSAEDGLNRIREILSNVRVCVRLAGLSGVGKTRFVQALFDVSIGQSALNPFDVFYTDMSNSPDPDPRSFAMQLVALNVRAILVIDNCPPELHNRMVEVCSADNSSISLITIEYDVRDDLPEQTKVFTLTAASDEIVFNLIQKRFPHINQIDGRSISKFAGGNARIAIALANTVQKGETLSGFQNEELFERLFQQRNAPDNHLMKAAEVLSLVYSFDGSNATEENSELAILGSIIDTTAFEMYRSLADLQRRDLLQQRDIWRAILPQAIANRLAKKALEAIPLSRIVSTVTHSGNERLLKSFSNRLKYLHDSEKAQAIVNEWLTKDGFLDCLPNFNSFGMQLFENIAPVSPLKSLEAIERASLIPKFTSRSNLYYSKYVRMLRSIAFDDSNFVRSVRIICQFAISEKDDEKYNSTRSVLKSLFMLHLSGTHAAAQTRYQIIEELLVSQDEKKEGLGMLLLDATLEAWHFNSNHGFDFGARPRDYGYVPKTIADVKAWYNFFIEKCTDIILFNGEHSDSVKNILAANFRGLWTKAGMYEALVKAAKKIHENCAWTEGWQEVRKTIYFDIKGFEKVTAQSLKDLSELLKPNGLLERIRAYTLSRNTQSYELVEDYKAQESAALANNRRSEEIARDLGIQLYKDKVSFEKILPELLSNPNMRLGNLGEGLAKAADDKSTIWQKLRSQYIATEPTKRNIAILLGFLYETSKISTDAADVILDEILTDNELSEWLPKFQSLLPIDGKGVFRLHKALDENKAPIGAFYNIAFGRAHELISDDELAGLLFKIASKENGNETALKILSLRFNGNETKIHSRALIAAGQTILKVYNFKLGGNSASLDYNLSMVAEMCIGKNDFEIAKEICLNIATAISSYSLHSNECHTVLVVLAKKQPNSFLDVFILSDELAEYEKSNLFSNSQPPNSNPLINISEDEIIDWCEQEPESRYMKIIGLIPLFYKNEGTGQSEWTPIFKSLLAKSQNKTAILNEVEQLISPISRNGVLAEHLKQRLHPMKLLAGNSNQEIASWAMKVYKRMEEAIINEQQKEEVGNKLQNETFE